MIRIVPFLFLIFVTSGANAQIHLPHEPFDATKAQSLPLEPGAIVVSGEEHPFQFEFADTDRERQIGLMHRAEIAPDRGMLFDFRRDRLVGMWMRNTFMPLDMLFLDEGGKVKTIAENTIPHNEQTVFSGVPVRAVLELKAGTVARLGIQTGDQVKHAMFED